MKIRRFLTMMFLFLFAFTMLPASKAMAEVPEKVKLTISDTNGNIKSTSEYAAYSIITFDANEDYKGKIYYTNPAIINSYRSTIISSLTGLPASPTDNDIFAAISKLEDKGADIAKLAAELKQVVDDSSISPAYTTSNGVFAAMDHGYYLVIETFNNAGDGTLISKPILVAVPNLDGSDEVNVKVKTSKATIEKKIIENEVPYDTNTAAIGDTINYRVVSDIPAYPMNAENITYYITDTFSEGLDFEDFEDDIKAILVNDKGGKVSDLVVNVDYILTTTPSTFQLALNNVVNIKNWGNQGYKLVVTYSAKLNSNASYGSVGNPNTIELYYSNNPGKADGMDTVITYTARLIIIKKDGGSGQSLQDVKFKLEKAGTDVNGNTIWEKVGESQITDVDGKAFFTMIEQGTYRLTEEDAPSGYIRIDPIEFTVSAENYERDIPDSLIVVDKIGNGNAKEFLATWKSNNAAIKVGSVDGILSAEINNTKGFTLPGTGGIGTTIFTIVGVSIILVGCSMLIVYFKRAKRLSSVK